MAANDPGPFPQDALGDNRAGRLTQAQRRGFRAQARGFRKAELQFAVVMTIIGLVVWFAMGVDFPNIPAPILETGVTLGRWGPPVLWARAGRVLFKPVR